MAVDLSEIKKYQNAQTFLFREKLVDLNLVGCGSLANRIQSCEMSNVLHRQNFELKILPQKRAICD